MRTREVFNVKGSISKSISDVDRLLASGKIDLTLDFKEATFVSVDGLEWLEELLLRSQSLQAKVSFVNVSPEIYKVFKVAHIDSLLEACGALSQSGPAC